MIQETLGLEDSSPPAGKGLNEVRVLSPAKINLFLEILGKRADGYHEIRTLMQVVDLWDEIHLRKREAGIELQVLGLTADVPTDERNLVYGAAKLILQEMSTREGVSITLYKRIPTGGGLGGGSSNAAATLWGMKNLFGLPFSRAQLRDRGLFLGSDVPFFLTSGCAIGEERGEVLREVEMPGRSVVIIYPGFGVASSWAYGGKKLKLTSEVQGDKLNRLSKDSPWEEMSPFFVNQLEEVVTRKYPLIRDLKRALLKLGARMALMSGSGSSVYGIFDDQARAAEAAGHWRGGDYIVHEGRTLDFNPVFEEEGRASNIDPFS